MKNGAQLIKDFVTKRKMDANRISCLVMALENARILSGRDKHSGAALMFDVLESQFIKENLLFCSDSFAGLIHYLLLLDLIGNVFKPQSPTNKKNAICNALTFSPINEKESRWAIVGLRNCIAHNYGLINMNNYTNHKFILLPNGGAEKMIQFPSTPWDGKYADKDESSSTKIDVPKLIDAIEETYQTIKTMAEKQELELRFKDESELIAKFTLLCN